MEKRNSKEKQNNPMQDLLVAWSGNQRRSSWVDQILPTVRPDTAPDTGIANSQASAAGNPRVSTDKADYAPGETAVISASGFRPGETITFAIADDPLDPGDDGDADAYAPFSITDGGEGDLDGQRNGKVTTSWQVPSDDDGSGSGTPDALNATLLLTASTSGGQIANTTFTDSGLYLVTEKSDYAPGDEALILASGFRAGSTIEFSVEVLSPGLDTIYGTTDDVIDAAATALLGETPWTVIDGSPLDLDNAIDGTVETSWFVDADAQGRTLRLTARGFGVDGLKNTADDEVAITSFTDAQGSFSKPYAHWADFPLPGDWNNNILNDNKSNYFEGEVIPHVFMYGASNNAQLVNGESYSFNVTYNYYQQNTDAGGFAYMTEYDLSRQPNVFDWATPAITPVVDSIFTNSGGITDGNGGADGGANFWTVDADITAVSGVTYTGTGTKDGVVTITFTYTGETTGNGYAAIYYGLYIAQPGEVPDQNAGTTNGAAAWSGGSLQTTVDIGGSGATSIQLAPSAIIQGEISGLKFNDLNGNGVKESGEPGLADWTIYLDDDTDTTNGNLGFVLTADGITDDLDGNGSIDPLGFYYFSVTPGTYYIYEEDRDGWVQTAPSTISYGPLVVSADTPTYLNKDFGNRIAETNVGLEGHKFHDLNGDGSWQQPGEPGLAGWTIYLDLDNDNSFDEGEPFDITADDGGWAITAELVDGTYYLREELEDGWIQSNPTTAVDGEYRIEVLNGAFTIFNGDVQVVSGDVDFGNFQQATKSGTKYEDLNANGILDDGDTALAGWTIYIDANANDTLDD
ncbi:hypothetical protein KBZ17_13395, partial [Cyanobium sp. A2C-AMD]|nr:hypothetical protein [Cyanobium sp. A2C-AMD]